MWFWRKGTDMGIDLGTATVLVYMKDKGIVLKEPSVVAIDACLGDSNSIGEIHARNEPIHPGKGVGKSLRSVGDMSIIAIVDSSENIDLFTSRPIRLSFILDMSKVIVDSLIHSYYLKNKKN